MSSEEKSGLCEFIDSINHNENDIQAYLETHTQYLVPERHGHGVMHSSIITKFPLGNKYVTDYVYLCKNSAFWTMYLVELEDAKKVLLRKDGKVTSAFSHAIGQVHDWKYYIESNEGEAHIRDTLKRFLYFNPTFGKLPIKFKYILIIGRTSQTNPEREREIRYSYSSENLIILTYDSLMHNAQYNASIRDRYIILSMRDGDKYKTKYFSNNVSTSLFAYLTSEQLKLEDGHRQTLIDCGYNNTEWEKGNL